MKKCLYLLVCLFCVVLFSSFTEARNVDLSNWLKNLSESALDTEPQNYDFAPEIVISGDNVHVLWAARKADWSAYQIYYRRSTDKGETWQDKILLADGLDRADVLEIARKMAVDGNNVHIFVVSDNYSALRYFRSTNGGVSFEEGRIVLNVWSGLTGVYAHASSGKLVVSYRAEHPDGYSINVLVSNDNGDNFGTHNVAIFNVDRRYAWVNMSDMQVDSDKIYLVYSHWDYESAWWAKVYFARSLDNGMTFQYQRIDVQPDENREPRCASDQDDNYVPKIALGGSTEVYTVFRCEDNEGKQGVFFRKSSDNGTTFSKAINLSKPELPDREIQKGQETVVAEGGKVYVGFLTTDGKVWFRRSLDRAESFSHVLELTAKAGYQTAHTRWPVIKIDPTDPTGSTVHVLGSGLFYTYSRDSGESFTGPVRLDTQFSRPDLRKPQFAIGMDGRVHTVIEGSIFDGDSDIFYRLFKPEPPALDPVGNKAMYLGSEYILFTGRWDTMEIASTPDIEFTTVMTVEAWVKPDKIPGYGGYFIVKDDGPSIVVGQAGQFLDGKVETRIATTDGAFGVLSAEPMRNNEWTHIAITYDANAEENSFRLYVNGNLVGEVTATGNIITTNRGPYLIGHQPSYYAYNSIMIDELRFWNRVLTADEIRYTMNRPLTGRETGLVAYYNFNEPISDYGTIRDITGRGHTGYLLYRETLADSDNVPTSYTLDVTKSGNGSGTVTSNPTGVSCGLDCSESYYANTPVALTAVPDSGSIFSGWAGDCSSCGSSTTCEISMTSNKTCKATFELLSYVLTSFNAGWNFISFPKLPPDTSLSFIFGDKPVRIVWSYDNETKRWREMEIPSMEGSPLPMLPPSDSSTS